MGARFKFRALLAMVMLTTGCAVDRFAVEAPSPERVAEVTQFSPVDPKEWSLPNGLTVLYLKDDELPLVREALLARRFALGT